MIACKPYHPDRFAALVEEFEKQEKAILGHKSTEYADDADRLENFHQQAIVQGVKPSAIALTYLLKHILSIAKGVTTGNQPWVWATPDGNEGLMQRFADARNYLLLLGACMDEERVPALKPGEMPVIPMSGSESLTVYKTK